MCIWAACTIAHVANGCNVWAAITEDSGSSQPLFKPKAEVFSLHDLEVATDHFHLNNKLGEGGFGSVYKVVAPALLKTKASHLKEEIV